MAHSIKHHTLNNGAVADDPAYELNPSEWDEEHDFTLDQTLVDHGSIGGLTDDDHVQYHNDVRALAWLGGRSTSDLPEGSNLYFTNERVDDRVAALIQDGTGITWSYDDGAGTLTPTVTVSAYTDEQAQDAVGAMVDATLVYVDATPLLTRAALTGAITAAQASNVTALGSFTKAQLDAAVSDGNVLYVGDVVGYTDEAVDDRVAALLQNGGGLTWTYSDVGGTLTPAIDHGGIGGLTDDDHTQYVLRSILTTNGDLFIRASGVVSRLGIGSNGDVLTVVTGAPAWATLPAVSPNALLDGSVHSDTVAQTVSRGSLIYGNSTPKWDELVIGAAGRVLWSDGTDAAWTNNPRIAGYIGVGSSSAPSNTTGGDITGLRAHIGTDAAFTTGVGFETNGILARFGGTITSASAIVGIDFRETYNGAGDGNLGFLIRPTFSPSSNSTVQYGFLGDAIFAPPTGVTITDAISGFSRTLYSGSVGAVTTGYAHRIGAPLNVSAGTLLPAVQYGLFIEDQGLAGMTTAVGLSIVTPTGATNKYALRITGSPSALTIPALVNSTAKKIPTTPHFIPNVLFGAAHAGDTFDINSTTYKFVASQFTFTVDLDAFPFTHYYIVLVGSSNAAGQTVSAQLATFAAPTTAIHTGGNDLNATITNSVAQYTSGWLSRDDAATGIKDYSVCMKGSNSTVDIFLYTMQVMLKIDP